ncbi:hypothetical protein BC829DRAFT_394502, partial [Chytridium lagenaria]
MARQPLLQVLCMFSQRHLATSALFPSRHPSTVPPAPHLPSHHPLSLHPTPTDPFPRLAAPTTHFQTPPATHPSCHPLQRRPVSQQQHY